MYGNNPARTGKRTASAAFQGCFLSPFTVECLTSTVFPQIGVFWSIHQAMHCRPYVSMLFLPLLLWAFLQGVPLARAQEVVETPFLRRGNFSLRAVVDSEKGACL